MFNFSSQEIAELLESAYRRGYIDAKGWDETNQEHISIPVNLVDNLLD